MKKQRFYLKNIVDENGVSVPRIIDIYVSYNPDNPMTRIAPSENLPSEIDFDIRGNVLKCRGVIKDVNGNIYPYGYVTVF